MRCAIKLSLTGVFIAGALAVSAVGSDAAGGANGPDAYIGIAGGHPGYGYSASGSGYESGGFQGGGYQGGGYQANTNRQHGHGWHGVNGWNYEGY